VSFTAPTVLHVNDCASTAAQLIGEAARHGMTWDYLPTASVSRPSAGLLGTARKATAGAAWVAQLAGAARRHDIVHVHSAGILRHARLGLRRYVLHCHGTDVRTQQYLPAWRAPVRDGLQRAEAVFFSTPDLAEHVLPQRPDASYLPVPIDTSLLPRWAPGPRPRVVFASRWGDDKGGQPQVDLAAQVVSAVADRADVIGLDWGPRAHEAAGAGVRLVAQQDRAGFLALLASAHAVVGQSAGILAASELEALGTGAPLVMPVPLPLYAAAAPPVLGDSPESATSAVVGLVTGTETHDPAAGQRYVADLHGVGSALATVLDTYQRVLAARG
jgi:hypothetical protein